jgi:hypothetical protein
VDDARKLQAWTSGDEGTLELGRPEVAAAFAAVFDGLRAGESNA